MTLKLRSVTVVSLNLDRGIHVIKPAKLYMCMQKHYKHDKDGHMAPTVPGHGSILLSHSGNDVARTGLQQHHQIVNPNRWNLMRITLTALNIPILTKTIFSTKFHFFFFFEIL